MIIVDTALEQREREGRRSGSHWSAPATWGAELRFSCFAHVGCDFVAIANRTLSGAARAFQEAGAAART